MFFPECSITHTPGRLALKLKNKAMAPLRNGDYRIYEDSVAKLSAEVNPCFKFPLGTGRIAFIPTSVSPQ